MPSAFNEVDGLSFSFGELQPISRINNELQSRAYPPGSISIESDAASPGETESSLFVWNTATVSTSPSLSSVTSARPNFTPVERFHLSEGRPSHHFVAEGAYKKYESLGGKKFSRPHAVAKPGTYWLGLAALALLVALTSALDPLRAKLFRASYELAKSDASMQLSWDDEFLPRSPRRLRIRASRAPDVSNRLQNSFHTKSEEESYHGSSSGAFDQDSLLFDDSTGQPNEREASFGSGSYDPFLAFSDAGSNQDTLHQLEPRYASKYERWRRTDTLEASEGTVPQWRRYSPVPSAYYGSSSEPDTDYAAERGSGYSTPVTDTLTDDAPSSGTDTRLELRRRRSGSDSSSSNSGGQRTGFRHSRVDRRRMNTLQHRQRTSVTQRSQRRGSQVAEVPSKGHRKRTKISRRSRVGTVPAADRQTAHSAPKRRWQRDRRSGRNSVGRRYPRVPSASVVSQVQTPKKNRFFLPESNVASGDASGEDDDSDEQETTSTYTHTAVLRSATRARLQSVDSASTSLSVSNSDDSFDGIRTSSATYQPPQSVLLPSSYTTGPGGDLGVETATRLVASRVSPDASFNVTKNQKAGCSGSTNASLPTEVLLYLVRQALEELVLSENAE